MENENEIPNNKILLFVLVIVILFSIYGICVYYSFSNWQERGTFGDAFGALNTLFSGLAFVGIIYTIFLQRKELALQRKELELTRQELKRTAEAQEKSEKALVKQVVSMERTAKLNALNTLLNYYSEEKNRAPLGEYVVTINNHCNNYIHKINLLFNEIEEENRNAS